MARRARTSGSMFTVSGALARRGGEALLRQRTATTMGVRFPSVEDAEALNKYGVGLYDGAAGVGIALIDLARATGDRRYRALDDAVEDGLIESTVTGRNLNPALYGGHAGIALHHLARARSLGDHDAWNRALDLGARLAHCSHTATDILGGAAGAGLLQLALFRASGDEIFRDGARRVVTFLEETAVADGGTGVVWPGHDPRRPLPDDLSPEYVAVASHFHTGLAHGAAGICLFLVEHAAATGDDNATRLYEEGFRWLDARAMHTGAGLVWPRSDVDPAVQTHWCHGSAGIAQAYLALHRHTGSDEALERAVAAARATWEDLRQRRDEPPAHCHGLSGALELFVDVAAHGGGPIWRRRAEAMVRRLAPRGEARASSCIFGGRGAGLSVGTAGVVRELLRFRGEPVFPVLIPARGRIQLPWRRPRRDGSQRTRRAAPVGRTISRSFDATIAELLPRVALRLAHEDRYVELGSPNHADARDVLRLLRKADGGDAYFAAVDLVAIACRKLTERHGDLLAPGALTPATFGLVLREIAGMALAPNTDPRRLRKSARQMTRHAADAMAVLLHRVGADLRPGGALERDVGGRLVSLTIKGGDSHRRGQRVVLLRFESGPPLLYKARSLAVDRELAGTSAAGESPTLVERVNAWLAPAVDGARLPTHRLIAAGQWHGYAERIEPTALVPVEIPADLLRGGSNGRYPLPDAMATTLAPDDDRRFWYSAGLLGGYAFTLGVHDLHAENVVCGTSMSTPRVTPHAIDLELAFGRVDELGDTGLLARPPATSAAVGSHDHTGLGMSLDLDCGLHAEEWLLAIGPDGVSPVARPHLGACWRFPHVVRNSDGSSGRGAQLGAFVRGFADTWHVLRAHATDVADHLRQALTAAPCRVLRKATRTYLAGLERRKMGGPPIAGSAHDPRFSATPFDDSELRQLDALDFPYYVRFLGEETNGRPGLWWTRGARDRLAPGPALESSAAAPPLPFFSIVDRQMDPQRFAVAVVDAVRSVVPDGPFDIHDRDLGVRVVRPPNDRRLWVVVLLGARMNERLTCRFVPDGGVEWWMD